MENSIPFLICTFCLGLVNGFISDLFEKSYQDNANEIDHSDLILCRKSYNNCPEFQRCCPSQDLSYFVEDGGFCKETCNLLDDVEIIEEELLESLKRLEPFVIDWIHLYSLPPQTAAGFVHQPKQNECEYDRYQEERRIADRSYYSYVDDDDEVTTAASRSVPVHDDIWSYTPPRRYRRAINYRRVSRPVRINFRRYIRTQSNPSQSKNRRPHKHYWKTKKTL